MASRVKLLNAAEAGTTGTPFKIGMGQPPYSIKTTGTYTNGAGAAGTNGVTVEVSPDLQHDYHDPNNPFPTAAEIAAATWIHAVGTVGGDNESETQVGELLDLHTKANCFIPSYSMWIRARAGANIVGTATCYFEDGR